MPQRAADLHIHTCLSPCGDLDMYPEKIVARALEQGLDVIAICDHNTADNAGAVMDAARGTPLQVLPGIEICTREEVHLVGVFPLLEAARAMAARCLASITTPNDPDLFGMQVKLDAEGVVLGFEDRLLLDATDLSLEEAVRQIHDLGGLAILAHVNREAFGVIGQLGFIPSGLHCDALELSDPTKADALAPLLQGHGPITTSSDAHYLVDIGRRRLLVDVANDSFEALADALRSGKGVIQ